MKHTLGPWKINWLDKRLIQVEQDGSFFGIADCANTGLPAKEELANAKLIAASPTMYKELKRIAGVPLLGEDGYCRLARGDALGFIRIARRVLETLD